MSTHPTMIVECPRCTHRSHVTPPQSLDVDRQVHSLREVLLRVWQTALGDGAWGPTLEAVARSIGLDHGGGLCNGNFPGQREAKRAEALAELLRDEERALTRAKEAHAATREAHRQEVLGLRRQLDTTAEDLGRAETERAWAREQQVREERLRQAVVRRGRFRAWFLITVGVAVGLGVAWLIVR